MMRVKSYADILTNYVRAGSENCSPQLLAQLAHSEVSRIRLRVAENALTPVEVLEELSLDKNPDVRIAVGTNPSTPFHLKLSLAFDEDTNVRLGLAEDMNTPLELLDRLAVDANPYVSCRAAQTKEYILSHRKQNNARSNRFFGWVNANEDPPGLRYA